MSAGEVPVDRLLWAMAAGRAFEEELAYRFGRGEVHGFLHLGVGEEATAVGGAAVLRDGDYYFTTHRGIAGVIMRGVPLDTLTAQALGKAAGSSAGRSDIVHVADRARGVMGASGTIGGNFPLALGTGWASNYRGDSRITLCSFGDGAVNRGTFLEATNLMAVWKTPVVLLCDNNRYSVSTPIAGMFAGDGLAERARGLGLTSVRIDGNDVLAVREAVSEAADRARDGGGPTFVEALTHRLRGHFEGDTQDYRPDGELEGVKAEEPIARFMAALRDRGHPPDELDGVIANAQEAVSSAFQTADAAPDPTPEMATAGVLT